MRTLSILSLVFGCAIAKGTAAGQGSPRAAELIASCEAAATNVKTFRGSLRSVGVESLDGQRSPTPTIEQDVKLVWSGDRGRWDTTGVLRQPETAEPVEFQKFIATSSQWEKVFDRQGSDKKGRGTVMPRRAITDARHADVSPVDAVYRVALDTQQIITGDPKFDPQPRADGYWEGVARDDSHEVRLVLDPARNFIPIRSELRRDDAVVVAYECSDFSELSPSVWLPLTFTRTSGAADGKFFIETTHVLEAQTNIEINDAELDLVFPKGLKVREVVPR